MPSRIWACRGHQSQWNTKTINTDLQAEIKRYHDGASKTKSHEVEIQSSGAKWELEITQTLRQAFINEMPILLFFRSIRTKPNKLTKALACIGISLCHLFSRVSANHFFGRPTKCKFSCQMLN